jgi:hypothetical protein
MRDVSPSADAQPGQKTGETQYFAGSAGRIIERGESRRLRAVIRNRDLRGIESPTGDIESISRDFDVAYEANRPRKLPDGSSLASRTPRRLLNHLRVTKDHKGRKHAPKRAIWGIGRS